MASIEYRVICIILPRSRRVQTSLSDAPLPYLHVRQELIVFPVSDRSSYQQRLCSTKIFLSLTSLTEASILLIFFIFCSSAAEKVSCLYTGIEIRRLSPKRRCSVMWICSFPSVPMHCLLHENATWSAEVLVDTGRRAGSLVHGCTGQEPPYMDVCGLRSRYNSYVYIPVSANALQTGAFSQQTGNVFGRLEN